MNRKIILASSSPRRIEMMKKHGYSPDIIPADIDETLPPRHQRKRCSYVSCSEKSSGSRKRF